MAFFARDEYVATAGQTDFTVTFDPLASTDIYAYVDGLLEEDWTLATASTLRFDVGLSAGEVVTIVRRTSHSERLVDWATASVITEADLDADSKQAFYMCQEAIDIASSALPLGTDNNWDAGGKLLRDIDYPILGTDAASKEYVDDVAMHDGNVPTPAVIEDGLPLVADAIGGWAWKKVAPAAITSGAHITSLLTSVDTAAARSAIGLGNVATRSTGVTENTVPLLAASGELATGIKGTNLDLTGQNWRFDVPIISGDLSTVAQWTTIEDDQLNDFDVLFVEGLMGVTNVSYCSAIRLEIDGVWQATGTDYSYVGYTMYYNGTSGAQSSTGAAQILLHLAHASFVVNELAVLRMYIYHGNLGMRSGAQTFLKWELIGPIYAGGMTYTYGVGNYKGSGNVTGIRLGTNNASSYQAAGAKYRISGMPYGAY